jgi:class 3 adenylate cyclase
MVEPAWQAGSVLGAYEIMEELGRGGLGIVYRSRHVHLGRIVALKVLHPLWTSSAQFVERFREEGRVMALLEHPNILRVYDAGQVDGTFYLATAYLEGKTLEALQHLPFPTEVTLSLARSLARALAYAHGRGVVHRDVKPANIMVGPQGEITLMDFGVARLCDAPGLTLPGVRVGTPFYMAPEQILGKRVDARADLYSLGVVFYQLAAGRLPFPGPTTEEVFEPPIGDRCPAWIRRVIAKLLAKTADDRFPDAQALLKALDSRGSETVLASLGVAALAPRSLPAAAPVLEATPQSTVLVKEDRAALSLDVVGSSRMKDPGLTLAAQQQFALFRGYVGNHLKTHACLKHQWSGDGLLALFARPSEAAACARAILDGLGALNAINEQWEQIAVRLGVHHGPVLMSADQPLGEVTSRTLDVAGHLQKRCPEDSALLSEAALAGLPDGRDWRLLEGPPSSSFPFPLYVYAPGGEAAGPAPARREQAAGAGAVRLEVRLAGGTREHFLRGETLIGRRQPGTSQVPDIDLREDEAISRRHARILPLEDGFYVEDLDSANGTRLNGEWLRPAAPQRLATGDLIELGEGTAIRVLRIDS